MRRTLAAAALTLAMAAGASESAFAQAPDVRDARSGKPDAQPVESRIVNVNEHVIQLDDGTVVRVPEGLVAQANLRAGRVVKVVYETKDKENVATSVEFLDAERK